MRHCNDTLLQRNDESGRPNTTLYHLWQRRCGGIFSSENVPCQIDGGLKCCGHCVGASGLRMAYEVYTRLKRRVCARQRDHDRLGLVHNLGAAPYNGVGAASILSRLDQGAD